MNIKDHNKNTRLNATQKNNTGFIGATFEMWPEEEELPYAQIPNDLLRSTELSPQCIWFISYLLSNNKNWSIKFSQIIAHLKGRMGRGAIYKLRKEALDSGYLTCHEYFENNLRRCKYYVSRTPRFKKSFLRDGKQEVENHHNYEDYLKEDYKKESIEKTLSDAIEKSSPKEKEDSFKKDSFLFHKEKKEEETAFQIDSPKMLEIYNLEPEYGRYFNGYQVSLWLRKFGVNLVLSTLRYFLQQPVSKIRNAAAWMEEAFKKNYANIQEIIENNKKIVNEFKQKYNLKNIKVNKRYIVNTDNGKELYFTFSNETFLELLNNIFRN